MLAGTLGYNLAVALLRGGPQIRTLFFNLVCPVADLSRLVLQLRIVVLATTDSLYPGTEREGGLIYNFDYQRDGEGLCQSVARDVANTRTDI